MLEKVCGAQNGAKRNMPSFVVKTLLFIVANVVYIVMSILEDLYYKPRASESAARVLDIVIFCFMVFVNGRILEG